MTGARERSKLVPLKAMPTGKSTPLENASTEIPPVITVDVIRPVCTIPVIVMNRSTFLAFRSRNLISSRRYVSISVNFLSNMFVVLVVP